MALMSVDLPAPLSPTTATTSPAWTSKSTSVSASTAPNRLVTPLSSRSGPSEAAVAVVTVAFSLTDSVLRAGRLVGAGADVGGLPVAVLDDGVLDLVGGHRGDVDLERRDIGLAVVLRIGGVARLLALDEHHGPLGGLLGHRRDRLVDGHVLLAGEDPLDPGDLGVLACDRDRLRVDAGRLHRRDRAAGGAVVGGVDADELALADRRDRLLHLRLRLVRRPVGGVVLLGDLEAGAVDHRVGAFLEQLGVVVGRRSVDHHDRAGS